MSARFVLLKRIKFLVLCSLAKNWWLYSSLIYVASPHQRKLLVKRNKTELVIEGFPRSGNTFAVVAFEKSQNCPVNISHHAHAQSLVIRAAALNIPICVLIRRPEDAIKSSLVMSPHLSRKLLLQKYIEFYSDIFRVKNKIVVATFDEVKSDFGQVIERINKRFGKNYGLFDHTEASTSHVYQQISEINHLRHNGRVHATSMPHPHKEDAKSAIEFSENEKHLLAQANEIYIAYCDLIR